MNSSWLFGIFLGGAFIFAVPTLRVLPVMVRLLAALTSGLVKWPGPMIHDPGPNVKLGWQRLGQPSKHLFSTFIGCTLGLVGAFGFSVLMLLVNNTSLLTGYIQIRWTWELPALILIVYIGGVINLKKVVYHGNQVNILLSDLASGAEPRQINGNSAETEYAIEHPLVDHQAIPSDNARALILFSEATKHVQTGNQQQALIFYQEAMNIAPSLHEHAQEALSKMSQDCSLKDAGPIYYWLGVHSEYLRDLKQAKIWYEKAINAFGQIGYQKRESRTHCNLGNVKMNMLDESAMEEFEKAITLYPRNGIAHLNIGKIYYGISEPGDDRYERALDAFADAIVSDPLAYGPMVISSLRAIGYTWKEDLEKITQRVENKRR